MANTTVNIDIQVKSKSLNELEQELAQINEELKQVPVGSQAFKELSTSAQDLNKQLKDVNSQVEGMTLEKKVRASQGAVTALAGGLEATVGTLGLLGVESEVFGEFEKKAISAIAASRGFIDIADGVGILTENINLASIKAKIFGITTKQAIIATGIGLFVVALGTVVAYWDDIVAGVEKFGQKVPIVGKAIQIVKDGFDALVEAFRPVLEWIGILPDAVERANKAAIASNDELIQATEREIAIMEASGASAKEISDKKIALLKAELDNLKRTNADKEEIYEKETEILKAQAAEQKRLNDEAEADRKKTQEKRAAALATFNAAFADNAKKLEDLTADSARKQLELEKKRAQASIEAMELEYEKKKILLDQNEEYFRLKQEQLTKIELEEAQKRLAAQAQDSEDILQNLFDVQMRYLEAFATTTADQIKIAENYRDKDLMDSKDAQDQKISDLQETYRQLLIDQGDNFAAIKALTVQYQSDVSKIEEAGVGERLAINKEYADLIAQLKQQEKIMEAEVAAFKVDIVAQAANNIAEFLTTVFEGSKEAAIAGVVIEKAAAIAGIIANTALANAKLVAAFPVTLGQPWVGINTAGAIASIATTVAQAGKAITQINNPPKSAGSGASLPSSPSAPATTGGTTPQNIQARAPQQLAASPISRTYVLTGDVTSGQEAEAKINTKRTII